MARSKALADRLAKLSPEKQALLQQRLERAGRAAPGSAAARRSPNGGEGRHAPEIGRRTALQALLRQPAEPLVDEELWEALIDVGRREARARESAEDLQQEAALGPEVDGKAVAYISLALARMGAFREAHEVYTLGELRRRCSILPDYRKAMRRWLATLVEDGLLETDGRRFSNPQPLPPPALVEALSDDERDHYGGNLAAMLTGRKHPLEFLIPGGSSENLEENYARSPIFRYCNGVSAALLAAVVGHLPAERRIRVLEIGAGTGGTSVSLLPVLPRDRAVYVYTDVSRFFVDLGRKKFAQYPFLHFAELDIDDEPRRQGLTPGAFDVVVAAHVLHATRELRATLRHVVSLLTPGGLLLLLEETRFLRNFHFTMGFLPGFDRFEDYDLRPMHPLLDTAQWQELLLSNGFSSFAAFTAPGALPDRLGVDVMLARRLTDAVVSTDPMSGAESAAIPRRRDRRRAPLSFAQERLWRYARERPGSSLHNVYHGVRLRGRLGIGLLQHCLHALVRRHEVLRSCFAAPEEAAASYIETDRLPVVRQMDLRLVVETEHHEVLGQAVRRLAAVPFELERGPLVRAVLFRLRDEESVLLLLVHHIIIDGWSLMLLVREMASLIAAFKTGKPAARSEPAFQFGDFAAWQRHRAAEGAFGRELDYWRRQLAGWSVDPAPMDLAVANEPRGASEKRLLTGAQLRVIKAFSQRSRVTLFTTLLTAFKVLLHRLTGESVVVVGTPSAGRGREELEGTVGFFLNLLPLRTRLAGNPTYSELLGRVREVTLAAYAHQDLPFEYLLQEIGMERSDGSLPFRAIFNLPTRGAGEDAPLSAAGVVIEPFLTGEVGSEVDLVFYAVEQRDGLRLHFAYDSLVFDRQQRVALIEDYRDLLEEITTQPEKRLS